MKSILCSFNLASNKPEYFAGLCENLAAKTADPRRIEITVAIDDNDKVMQACIEAERKRRPFAIKALAIPPQGYYNLWKGINRLHRELCDPDAYFVCNINDEIRIKTQDWDKNLERYVGIFDDHIFRLRTSRFKLRNYFDFWECGYAPENYAFYTKRWLDVAGGDWNACHGPDSFQQFIAYYLWKSTDTAKDQLYRDVPIFDVEIGGEGVNVSITDAELTSRWKKGWVAWFILVSHEMQTEANRRARLIQATIAADAMGYDNAKLVTDDRAKKVMLVGVGGQILLGPDGQRATYSYKLSWLRISLSNFLRGPMRNYYCGGGPEVFWETLINIPFAMFPFLHPKGRAMRPIVKAIFGLWHLIKGQSTHATDHAPGAPPRRLNDGTFDPWGSAETDTDTIFWVRKRFKYRATRIGLCLHSPNGRAHLRDVCVVLLNENNDWIMLRARPAGEREFREKITVPPLRDTANFSIEIDPESIVNPSRIYGLACFSASRGYERNYLPEGRGIYVRELHIR